MINWYLFTENSSSLDALLDFTYPDSTLKNLKNDTRYHKFLKPEINKINKLGVKKARRLAKLAAKRYGFII